MLTKSQHIVKFFSLVIIFSLIVGVISCVLNNLEFDKIKDRNNIRSLELMGNLMAASVIMLVVCTLYYLLNFIPQVRASITIAGILVFILSYIVLTTFVLVGSLGPFSPFERGYLLTFLSRFAVTFFIPHVDRFLAGRLVTGRNE